MGEEKSRVRFTKTCQRSLERKSMFFLCVRVLFLFVLQKKLKKNVSHLTFPFLKRGLNLEKVMFSHSEGNIGREDTKGK